MYFVNLLWDHLNLKYMKSMIANENIMNIEISIVITDMNNMILPVFDNISYVP